MRVEVSRRLVFSRSPRPVAQCAPAQSRALVCGASPLGSFVPRPSGYFTYDAATGTYLDVNIRTTQGADPNNPLGKPPANLYYYPWPNCFNPTMLNNWSTASVQLQWKNCAGFSRIT